ASNESLYSKVMKELEWCDVVHFGDNHKGFTFEWGTTVGVNCGTFMRREISEKKYKPKIAVLSSDKSILPIELYSKKDVLVKSDVEPSIEVDINDLAND